MYLPHLRLVSKVLPEYLLDLAREEEGEGLLKMWLLDDMPSGTHPSPSLHPLQAFVRSDESRIWLDQISGGLVQIYMLAAPREPTEAGDSGRSRHIEVLARSMSFSLAAHHVARLLGVRPDELPILVGYVSLDLPHFWQMRLAKADSVSEVRRCLARSIESLKEAARSILGVSRVEALIAKRSERPVSPSEAREIAMRLRQQNVSEWREQSVPVERVIERIGDILRRPRSVIEPDARLHVARVSSPNHDALRFSIEVRQDLWPLPGIRFGCPAEGVSASTYFQALFGDIEALDLTEADPSRASVAEQLAWKGEHLCNQILPQDLQRILWCLRSENRTLQVVSEEGWIPWELITLQGDREGRRVSGPAIGEVFATTRSWLGQRPVLHLPMEEVALVVGDATNLAAVPEEAQFIQDLSAEGRRVTEIPSRLVSVRDALESGRYDVWHFTGHGHAGARDPHAWGVELASGEILSSEVLSGAAANLGRAAPLVFLNVCRGARTAASLTGTAGLAHAFIAAGAGAVVAPYWEVRDSAANLFSRAFYREFIAGTPLGEAVRRARLEVRKARPHGSSWLAYTVIGHPLATCSATGADQQN